MILTKYIFKTIKSTLTSLGYRNFLYLAPQGGATYPLVTYMPINLSTQLSFNATGIVLDDVTIRFSVYGNQEQEDCEEVMDILAAIEGAFEFKTFTDGTYTIICGHRTNENGPTYLNKEHYWIGTVDITFMSQRQKV